MKKNFPRTASDFINDVEKYSGSPLNRKAELIIIVEEAKKNSKEKIFEDLVFTAKYIISVLKLLEKKLNNPSAENIENIKKDFSAKLIKTSEQVKEILSSSDENIKNHFEETYFGPAEKSLYNINELLADLECTEMYLNEMKIQGIKYRLFK